jgi:outer membrane protein assembly factor BamD
VRIGLFFSAAILATCLVAGCPSIWNTSSQDYSSNPEELYKQAEDNFQKKNFDQAIDLLERVKSGFPDFGKTAEVYLKLGDVFYEEKAYEKATSRYLQFIELFPNHKEVPKAKFNIAMCYFNQIKGTDLDNRAVKLAADSFKAVTDLPDPGEWGKKAEEKLRECRQKLAAKELYKARTYISVSNYTAARMAAQRVLDEYSKLGYDEEAKDLIQGIKGK